MVIKSKWSKWSSSQNGQNGHQVKITKYISLKIVVTVQITTCIVKAGINCMAISIIMLDVRKKKEKSCWTLRP